MRKISKIIGTLFLVTCCIMSCQAAAAVSGLPSDLTPIPGNEPVCTNEFIANSGTDASGETVYVLEILKPKEVKKTSHAKKAFNALDKLALDQEGASLSDGNTYNIDTYTQRVKWVAIRMYYGGEDDHFVRFNLHALKPNQVVKA